MENQDIGTHQIRPDHQEPSPRRKQKNFQKRKRREWQQLNAYIPTHEEHLAFKQALRNHAKFTLQLPKELPNDVTIDKQKLLQATQPRGNQKHQIRPIWNKIHHYGIQHGFSFNNYQHALDIVLYNTPKFYNVFKLWQGQPLPLLLKALQDHYLPNKQASLNSTEVPHLRQQPSITQQAKQNAHLLNIRKHLQQIERPQNPRTHTRTSSTWNTTNP
jgi:hypothetical protein